MKYPLLLVTLGALALSTPLHAQHLHTEATATASIGELTLEHAWSRATPSAAPVAGGYLTIRNNGKTADKLLGGSSDIAQEVEVHEMALNNGVMTMRSLAAGLDIKPGESVQLQPGGFHIMFTGLKRQLKQGETFKAQLNFARAGKVEVVFSVRAMNARPEHNHSHHSN
jgi:copper(I)-binding protein